MTDEEIEFAKKFGTTSEMADALYYVYYLQDKTKVSRIKDSAAKGTKLEVNFFRNKFNKF